jgi:hypothetical protein
VGNAFLKTAASPPTMMERDPFWAPSDPPDTGAFRGQAFFFSPGAVMHRDFMTGPEDVHRHSDAHCSHTDECNFYAVLQYD